MKLLPGWLVSMFVGLLGASGLGAVGAPAVVALLGGAVVGLVAHRSRRDPPWTPAGRRRWRESWVRLRGGASSLAHVWRSRPRSDGRPFGARPGSRRAAPRGGWPGGPGTAWYGERGGPAEELDDAGGAEGVVTVRCEIVTERLQVWHSTDTGRAYEVPVTRGLPGAAPGDLGSLSFDRGRPRVGRRAVN